MQLLKQIQEQNEQKQELEYHKLSFMKVVKNKLYLWLDKTSGKKIIRTILNLFLTIFFTLLIQFPKQTFRTLITIFSAFNYMTTIIAILWTCFHHYRFFVKLYFKIKNKIYIKTEKHIEGIPLGELLHHIFNIKTFKGREIIEKFSLSQPIYRRLIAKLDKANVFIRGDKNARLLNPELSRQEVADILNKENIEKISKPLKIYSFGKTNIMSKKEIHHSLENEFKIKPLYP